MSEVKRRTCLVTVTYGNRGALVVQVIDSAIKAGVSLVVVVDNGATKGAIDLVKGYISSLDVSVTLIHMGGNSGSAGGFSRGLREAYLLGAEYIWTLDDDNVAELDALKKLEEAHELFFNGNRFVALCSYREDRKTYSRAVNYGEVVEIEGNSFLDFHLFRKVVSRLFRRRPSIVPCGYNFPLVVTKLAPYGGLYISRDLIDKIGYPDERLFLYGDDNEYTSRVSESGGIIYICTSSKIKDIDESWSESSSRVPGWVDVKSDAKKVYFAARNRIILEQKFVDSEFVYKFNFLVYLCFLFFVSVKINKSISFTFKRILLLREAFSAGCEYAKTGAVVDYKN